MSSRLILAQRCATAGAVILLRRTAGISPSPGWLEQAAGLCSPRTPPTPIAKSAEFVGCRRQVPNFDSAFRRLTLRSWNGSWRCPCSGPLIARRSHATAS